MSGHRPIAIIDIGSNSVRLVVYSGATRIPSTIFNEKVMAGLGKALNGGGAIPVEAQERALAAIARFALLLKQMDAARVRIVATAAVRDASNGADFLRKVRALGLEAEVLPGEKEAKMAGLGVLSSIPEADGIVGDLGGGSLELVDIGEGEVRRSASLPLGVLRLGGFSGKGELRRAVTDALDRTGFAGRGEGRAFYMVGGSWRTLARIDMAFQGHPLPIVHQHEMAPERPAEMLEAIDALDKAKASKIPSLSMSRLPTLPGATRLLRALAEQLRPDRLVTSSFGIREGLLYAGLTPEQRREDPLIAAARDAGTGLGRFAQHGALLDGWIAPIFDDSPAEARLRLAACYLADVAWQAHPDFRAERGLDLALHGNWVGIDAAGRVMLAQALYSSFGGGRELPDGRLSALCGEAELERAWQWGLALRLAQRLSGGVATGLKQSRLSIADGRLLLTLEKKNSALFGETVDRRLKTLAGSLGLKPELRLA
jgi:exopolyphosphatase/guanosine-5'-triphosphate,3'-diphosphate pyrophosphatase